MIFLLLACQPEVEPSETWLNNRAYLHATNASGQEALRLCGQITEQELKGECVWFSAKKMASQRQDSRQMCNAAPTETWKQACFFDVIDSLGMTGVQADQACAQTGEFQERCMIHAILREEDQYTHLYPEGKESEMMDAIRQRMEKLGVVKFTEEPIHQILTARVMARRFEARWRQNRGFVFSERICNGVPEQVCSDAYRIAIKQIGKGKLPNPCRLPVTTNSVEAVGLPIWSEGVEESVQKAWKSLCRASYGPQKPPDHASSIRANPVP